jgi:hypothetical protein
MRPSGARERTWRRIDALCHLPARLTAGSVLRREDRRVGCDASWRRLAGANYGTDFATEVCMNFG